MALLNIYAKLELAVNCGFSRRSKEPLSLPLNPGSTEASVDAVLKATYALFSVRFSMLLCNLQCLCDVVVLQERVQAKDPPSHYLNKLRTYLDPKASRSSRVSVVNTTITCKYLLGRVRKYIGLEEILSSSFRPKCN